MTHDVPFGLAQQEKRYLFIQLLLNIYSMYIPRVGEVLRRGRI